MLTIELAGRRWTQVLRPGLRTPVELELEAPAGRTVDLRIRAARTWTPSADGASTDERALAFRLLEAVLTH